MRLYSGMLGPAGSAEKAASFSGAKVSDDLDVTQQSVLLYGGTQHFDIATGTLGVCVILANRGQKPIRVPVKLEAKDVRSPIGTVSILNANNGLTGSGATWDISQSVTGDQIPPRAQSHPFCFSFHVEIPVKRASLEGADLLNLKVRVLASASEHSEAENQSVKEPEKNE